MKVLGLDNVSPRRVAQIKINKNISVVLGIRFRFSLPKFRIHTLVIRENIFKVMFPTYIKIKVLTYLQDA